LLKTFTIYVRENTINSSYSDASVDEIKHNIIYIDDIESLVLLYNLNQFYKKSYKIKWIATELFEDNISSENSNFEILNNVRIANFLEFWQEPSSRERGVNYRIDFKKVENSLIDKLQYKLSDIKRNSKKYFFFDIFNIQLNKDNSIPIIEQTLQNIKYKDISITTREHRSVYIYRCQICNKKHEVILSKSKRDTKSDIKKYTRVDDNFIHLNDENRYEILCDHKGSEYENSNLNFSFDKEKLGLNEDENININKVFLYQFYNFARKEDEAKIEFYKGDIITDFSVNKFIDKFGNS